MTIIKTGDYAIWNDNEYSERFQIGDLVKILGETNDMFLVSSIYTNKNPDGFYKRRFKKEPASKEEIVKAKLLGIKIHE